MLNIWYNLVWNQNVIRYPNAISEPRNLNRVNLLAANPDSEEEWVVLGADLATTNKYDSLSLCESRFEFHFAVLRRREQWSQQRYHHRSWRRCFLFLWRRSRSNPASPNFSPSRSIAFTRNPNSFASTPTAFTTKCKRSQSATTDLSLPPPTP